MQGNSVRGRFGIYKVLFPVLFLLAAAPIAASLLRAQQSLAPPAPQTPVGERLVYTIEWNPPWYLFFLPSMHAGNAELQITGDGRFKDRDTLKIVFKAYSSGILASLSKMEIDDEFVFLSEPETFCTRSVSKRIREGKRKRQIDVEYLPDTRQLHIRELDEKPIPPKLKRDMLKDDIPPCVQDPFSALYFLRRQPLHADFKMTSLVGHDDVIKEVQSKVEKLESVKTPEGRLPAWKIQTVSLMGGLFKDGGQFKIWLSADDRQIPVQFEAKVPLGRIFGKLKEIRSQEPEAGSQK
jgi:hypothetical protein